MGREINEGREGEKIRKRECMIEARQSMTQGRIAKKKCHELDGMMANVDLKRVGGPTADGLDDVGGNAGLC